LMNRFRQSRSSIVVGAALFYAAFSATKVGTKEEKANKQYRDGKRGPCFIAI
jgi:hypothetical protein